MEGRLWIVPTPSKLVNILLEIRGKKKFAYQIIGMILVRIAVVTQKMETPPLLN